MRTKDNYPVRVGMWIHNKHGYYEIRKIRPTVIVIKEVLLDSPNADEWGSVGTDTLGDPIYEYSAPTTIRPMELVNYSYT